MSTIFQIQSSQSKPKNETENKNEENSIKFCFSQKIVDEQEENFKLTFHSLHNDDSSSSHLLAATSLYDILGGCVCVTRIRERENFCQENHKFCTFHLILLKLNFHFQLHSSYIYLKRNFKSISIFTRRIHISIDEEKEREMK